MTRASLFRMRHSRALVAFVVAISAVVLVPDGPVAAAGDDLSIHKAVDNTTIAQGAVSTWTLTIDTSADVGLATAIVVTDTLPDGLCPLGAGDPDCLGGPAPSPAYTSAVENADGSWTLVWDLPDMAASEQVTVTYATVTRTHYQEGFADDTPVLARDSWTNTVHLDGLAEGLGLSDDAAAGQSAGAVPIAKGVASRPAALSAPGVCGDGAALSWNAGHADGYRVGDQVCWRLVVDYPTALGTRGSTVGDVLPAGHLFTADDSWSLGVNNTVPPAQVDGSAIAAGDSILGWTVGDGEGYVDEALYLEIVFSSTIVVPNATASGQTVSNRMNFAHVNSKGAAFNSNDVASISVLEPELVLLKGVTDVNSVPTGGGINNDGVYVSESDVVTYQLTIINNGDVDADDVEIWDLLASEYATCSTTVSSIDAGGVCVDGSNRIEWTGPATFTVPAGDSVTRTYDVTIPTGIAPDETMINEAGVRAYTSAVNNGTGSSLFVPVSNIDPSIGGENTALAEDQSHVMTPRPTIANSRSTSISEAGNADWQATVGELTTYTVTLVIPEGTTVYDAVFADDLPANLDLVSSSHSYDGEQALAASEDGAADSVTIAWPDPSYTNAAGTGDDTLTVTVVARVLDVPINTRGTSVGSTAEFDWDDAAAGERTSVDASVATTVVEPALGISKTSVDSIDDDGIVLGGETVDYTITISDSGAANVSTAHDLVVVDTLPEGETVALPVPDGGIYVADTTPGDGVGGTITWPITALSPGASLERTYQVTIDDPVTVSTVFVNNVVVDGSSIAGVSAVERGAGTGYHASAGHILNSPLVSITHSVQEPTATIGDIATYEIDVTIPPGTIIYDATVTSTLPAGTEFDGMTVASCDMAGSACDPAISVAEIGVVGSTTASFFLGDIDMSSVSGESRTVTITLEAHLTDVGTHGDSRLASATIYGNATDVISGTPGSPPDPTGLDISAGPTTASLRIVEPLLSIDKDVSGQLNDDDHRRARPADTLSYAVVVTNSNSAWRSDAFDLTIVDAVPENVAVTLPIADGGVWVGDTVPNDGVGGTITWTVPGPIPPGGSLTRGYVVTVDASLDSSDEDPANSELDGDADVVSYFGASGVDRLANPSFAFRNYDNVTADQVEVELDLASIGNVVWYDIDADGGWDLGEPPLAGIDLTVTYLGPVVGSSSDDEVHVVSTVADGSYLVEYLPGGQYTVVVDVTDLLPGFTASYDLDDGTLSPDDMWGAGPLLEDEDKLNTDFGYTGTGSIGATVWFDIDRDGLIDPDEYGLQGVDVVITWTAFDGVPSGDDVTYRTTTGPDGGYLIPNLPAGDYTVDIDTLTLPLGMHATYDFDGISTPNATSLSLVTAESNTDQKFGYAGAGAIGNWVWLDKDGDAVQDLTESGLAGVPVQLTWPGEDGLAGGGDDELFLTTTDNDGFYLFDSLPPGEYSVDVLGGLPAAASNTYDEDGGNDSVTSVLLADAEHRVTADFGYQGTASIGDVVWWDMDADGVLDVGEPGLGLVEIILTYAGEDGTLGTSDDLALIGHTNAAGSYLFSDLPAGNYRVAVNSGEPAGMVPTFDEDGGLDELSLVPGLVVDQIHLSADFGYNGTGSIGDYIWLDLDADGLQDAIEPGIPGVDVDVVWYGVDGTGGTADDVVVQTTSDLDGNYLVIDLPAGGYDVAVRTATLPNGVSPTYDADGGVVHQSSLVLGDGEADLDQDFGYNGGGSIGDTVWFDRNADGVFDADEYGVPGVDVEVIWAGPDGLFATADDELFTTTTDADGNFLGSSLPPGGYAVIVQVGTLPPGTAPTFDEDGTLDNQTLFTLGDGEMHQTADFGYNGSGDIGGEIWLDLDGDGLFAVDEPGAPGQVVALTWAGRDDVSGNGDDHSYLTASDVDGGYRFDHLPPGDYSVEMTGSLISTTVNTMDEDGDLDSHTDVVLGDGVSHSTADFGYQGSAEIGDRVWLDLDGNGLDDGEPGLSGVELTMVWYGTDGLVGGPDDLTLPLSTSDGFGAYLATGLPSGAYGVAVTGGLPAGVSNSFDEDGDLDGRVEIAGLSGGSSHLTADFGFGAAGSIGDMVWWDLDGDGVQTVDEPGMHDIDVDLTWAGWDGVLGNLDDASFAATTAVDGAYLFEHLVPGVYRLVVDEADLVPGLDQSADPDATLDSRSTITLGDSVATIDQDFGYHGRSSVGDLVWWDLNLDRVHVPVEPGVGDVAIDVVFLGPDGAAGGGDDVAFTATTGGDGGYLIPGLPSGFYVASIDAAALADGLEVIGDLDGNDPLSTAFALGEAAAQLDVDYAVVGDSSLSGTVWNDRNGNGLLDPAEVGIAGVEILATWHGPSGLISMAAESDPFGFWELRQLPSGDFDVELDATSAPLGMGPTTGTTSAATLGVGGASRIDFGLALLLDVGSVIWIDANGDGMVGEGESGIPEVLVNLYDEDEQLVAFTETDDDGFYSFNELYPGLYSVEVVQDSLPPDVLPTWDRDGTPDLATALDLTGGTGVFDANFGFQSGLPNTGLAVDTLTMVGTFTLVVGWILIIIVGARRRFMILRLEREPAPAG